jgi:hypothetical protein
MFVVSGLDSILEFESHNVKEFLESLVFAA